ncbi:MAG TPA: RNB domain-containing ribonuclease [Terriglobales bacterium]|nr:RNB domain-containing ribonuclease [Terriglobales bacterium]
MLRDEALSEDDVLDFLGRASGPASVREIASSLSLRHAGRRALGSILSRLKRQRLVEEVRGGRYRLARKTSELRHAEPDRANRLTRHAAAVRGARDPDLLTGHLVAHRDGYGFVVPDSARRDLDGDLFIPPDQLGDAMHGDQVVARIERRDTRGARLPLNSPVRAEGRIVRVLGRAHPTVVGVFHYGHRSNFVTPFESRIRNDIIIPPGEELTPELLARHKAEKLPSPGSLRLPELEGAVVNVELTRFPGSGVPAAARVIEILGRRGEFGVDVEILIRKHHLPHRFSQEVLDDARRVARAVGNAEREARRDFRHLPIITIDGETARDFDDAVYVEKRRDGWHLQVHIADVDYYVGRNSALDREARVRGTSVYFPDRAVPMLPDQLSNGICSLNPREDRLVMSVLLEIDNHGEVTDAEFTPGVIRSAERMTYTAVNQVIEGDPVATSRYAALAGCFREMRDLALILNARRTRRGSMDFDLPERVLTFDAEGQMTGIVRSERNIAHRLIEEFMLAANQAVATYLESRGIASLHRVHEKPDPKKVLEFEEVAHAFGYSLGVPGLSEHRITVRHGRVAAPGRTRRGVGARERPMVISLPSSKDFQIQPLHYQRLTKKIAGKPEERILSYLMLRSLKQARYADEPLGHFALAFDQYTHFTSPIRRYPDLIVHRVLKWALAHPDVRPERIRSDGEPEQTSPYSAAALAAIALESSEAERRADAVERELMDWKTAQFMEQHLGDEYEALVISVQKFGFFVELMEIFVEGLVPMNHLEEETGAHCFYRERDHAIVSGRGSRTRIWKLGDRVRVRADRIDPMRHRIEFALAT